MISALQIDKESGNLDENLKPMSGMLRPYPDFESFFEASV